MFEIGSTLREARERQKLGLDRAEAETKIRARYLRALEDEDFDLIPGPTYVRGFLRTYAARLDLDSQLFVDEYNSRFFSPRDDDPAYRLRRPTARGRRAERRETNVILIALAAMIAIAVLVIAWTWPPSKPAPAHTPATSTPAATGPINPQLGVSTTAKGDPGPITLVVIADRRSDVIVYPGRGTHLAALFSDTLDPATGNDRYVVRAPSGEGFTIAIGVPGSVHVVVTRDGRPQTKFTKSAVVFVAPNGTVTKLR
jgi:hypothetical protein